MSEACNVIATYKWDSRSWSQVRMMYSSIFCVQVSELIKESRQALADSLFSWTCQSPLTKDDTLSLIGHLETVTAQADGSLDSVNLALVMALLYCLDVSFIEQGTEDREGENMLPIEKWSAALPSSLINSCVFFMLFCWRSSPSPAFADRKALCVCSTQSSDG